MVLGEAVTVAGLGCRRGVTAAEVLDAIDAARAAHGGPALVALATLSAKRDEPALADVAGRLGLPLLIVAPGDDGRLRTRSAASRAATGAGSASEAAALAAAGPEARLLGPRLVVGRVTCALAVGPAP
jgi:cobalt-precorrin 5A hydrolase